MAYTQLFTQYEVIGELTFPAPGTISVMQKAACKGQLPTYHINIFGDLNNDTLSERIEKYYIHNLSRILRAKKGLSRSLLARVAVIRLVDQYDPRHHKIHCMLEIIDVEKEATNILQKGLRLQSMVSMVEHHNQRGGIEREGQVTGPRMVLFLGDGHIRVSSSREIV